LAAGRGPAKLLGVRMRILLVLLAACGAQQRPRPTTGSIAGLVRDRASGEPVALAEIRVRPQAARELVTKSTPEGLYAVDHLQPGRYSLLAKYAGQPVTIQNIDVAAGDATFVDITFTLGAVEPLLVDYGDPRQGAISRYTPKHSAPRIEGTVSDAGSKTRIVGAVVTAIGPNDDTLQTISDNHGRYYFTPVVPGTYIVSAYYSIGGRAQIEIRRSDITVAPTEAVVVPLWIETTKQ
jgi:hypothetical protein